MTRFVELTAITLGRECPFAVRPECVLAFYGDPDEPGCIVYCRWDNNSIPEKVKVADGYTDVLSALAEEVGE